MPLHPETASEREARLARVAIARSFLCDDAPVSAVETMAEVHARLQHRQQRAAGAPSWDVGEIARSALGEMPERARAELLTDLLCDLRGRNARKHLTVARNRITAHLHDLITAEYDAEVAARPGEQVAELARGA